MSALWQRLILVWIVAVQRRAAAVLLASLTATLLLGWYAVGHLGINTDTTGMLSEELPFRKTNAAIEKAFPDSSDLILLLIEADSADAAADGAQALVGTLRTDAKQIRAVSYFAADPFFRRNGLLFLSETELSALVDQLSQSQALLATLAADPGLRSLAKVLALALDQRDQLGAGEAPLADALTRMADVAEAHLRGEPAVLSWRELMSGRAATVEDRRQLVVVQPRMDFQSMQPAGKAIDEIRALADQLGLAKQGVRVRLTGGPVMAAEELASVEVGIGWIGALSSLMVALILWRAFRSPRLAIYTFVTMIAGLIWTFAFAAAAIGQLNMISVAFAVLFIGLSVDFGIHFGMRYREHLGFGLANGAALKGAASRVGGAMALAALAAAIGFLAFLPTAYVGLSELGLIAAFGMLVALVSNLTILPALLALWPTSPPASPNYGEILRPAHGIVRRKGHLVIAAGGVLALLGGALLPQARFDFDPINLRDQHSEAVAAFRDIGSDRRAMPYTASLLLPDLKAARAAGERVAALPEVKGAATILDFVPEDQDAKLDLIDQARQFLTPVLMQDRIAPASPAERQAAAEMLARKLGTATGLLKAPAQRLAAALRRPEALEGIERALLASLPARLAELGDALAAAPVGVDDIPAELRATMVGAGGQALVRVYPKEDARDPAALRRFVRAVQSVAPDAAGPAVTIVEAGDAVVGAFREASIVALGCIFLMLLAVLRSLRDTLLVLTPLALAGLLTGAASVLLGVPFNFANVIVLPLLLGLGVSSGIYIVMRDREARGLAATSADVLRTATPRAVVFSALTTIVSFGSLTFSAHPGTASMGILLTSALTFALVCTLLLLPALLDVVAGKHNPTPAQPGATPKATRKLQEGPVGPDKIG